MDAHAIYYYSKISGFAGDVQNYDLTDIIPQLVNDSMNTILTSIPSI